MTTTADERTPIEQTRPSAHRRTLSAAVRLALTTQDKDVDNYTIHSLRRSATQGCAATGETIGHARDLGNVSAVGTYVLGAAFRKAIEALGTLFG